MLLDWIRCLLIDSVDMSGLFVLVVSVVFTCLFVGLLGMMFVVFWCLVVIC